MKAEFLPQCFGFTSINIWKNELCNLGALVYIIKFVSIYTNTPPKKSTNKSTFPGQDIGGREEEMGEW